MLKMIMRRITTKPGKWMALALGVKLSLVLSTVTLASVPHFKVKAGAEVAKGEGTATSQDRDGNVILIGFTGSKDLPVTDNALQRSAPNGTNAFVAKLSADRARWIYLTYIGGYGDDEAFDVATDRDGNAYVVGVTDSYDLQIVGGFQIAKSGSSDAFLAKFSPDGRLLYSTFIGGHGADMALGVTVGADGIVFVTGTSASASFPVSVNAVQGTFGGVTDAFLVQIDTTKAGMDSLRYSTFLGGKKSESGFGIAVDGDTGIYVTGMTRSANFPTQNGAFEKTLKGASDAFVTKFNLADGTISYSTLFGGSGTEYSFDISVDADGNAVVAGLTESADMPVSRRPYRTQISGSDDGFLFKLNESGTTLMYSTFVKSDAEDEPLSLSLDGKGNAILSNRLLPDIESIFQSRNVGVTDSPVLKIVLPKK